VAQPVFLQKNAIVTLTVEKSSPNFGATFVTFVKLYRLSNFPKGKNSPNLVTLVWANVISAPIIQQHYVICVNNISWEPNAQCRD
jgi:hypothetical protein